MPPKITAPPGANIAEPGVFKSIHGIVRLIDLRVRFGVDEADRATPGKVIITEVEGGHAGFWVDEIEDVIGFPEAGWGQVPAYIPRNVFARILIQEKTIRLYADLEKLDKFKTSGYLRKHIEMIKLQNNKNTAEDNESSAVKNTYVTEPGNNKEKNIKLVKVNAAELSIISQEKMPIDYNPPVKEIGAADKNEDEIRINKSDVVFVAHKKTTNIKTDNEVDGKKHSPIKNITSSKAASPIENSEAALKLFKNEVKNSVYVAGSKAASESKFDETSNKGKKTSAFKTHNIDEENQGRNGFIWFVAAIFVLFIMLYFIVDIVTTSKKVISKDRLVEPDFNDYKTNEFESFESNKKSFAAVKKMPLRGVEKEAPIEHENVTSANAEISKTETGVLIVVNDYIESSEDNALEKLLELSVDDKGVAVVSAPEAAEPAAVYKNVNTTKNQTDELDAFAGHDKKTVENTRQGVASVLEVELPEQHVSALSTAAGENKKALAVEDVRLQRPMKKYIHRVVKGDTLWHIAKKYVNNPWRYPELAKLSNIKNPDLIYPGDQVTIIINYRQH